MNYRKHMWTVLYVLGLIFFAVVTGLRRSDCFDVFGHMAAGREILHFGILDYDIFTFTFDGKPWANIPWLFQIPLYLLYQWQGYKGIILLKGVLSAMIFFFLYLVCRLRIEGKDREIWPVFLPLLVLGFILIQMRFTARPHMVTMIFTVIYLYVMYLYMDRGGSRALYALPPLQILWANVHGSLVLGPFIIGVFLLERIAGFLSAPEKKGWNQRLSLVAGDKKVIALAVLLAVMCLVSFISPHPGLSFKMIQEFSAEEDISLTRIAEWLPFDLNLGFNDLSWSFFAKYDKLMLVFLLLLLVAMVKRSSALRVSDAVFFVFSVVSLLSHRRFVGDLGLLLTPALIYYWYLIYRDTSKYHRIIIGTALMTLCCLFSYCHFAKVLASDDLGFTVKKSRLCSATVQFITKNNLSGNVFNTYSQGYYFSFELYPRVKVFIDGRPVGVYNPAFFFIYAMGFSGNRFPLIERLYPIDMVCVDRECGLYRELLQSDTWKPVLVEPAGGLFLKKDTPFTDLRNFKVNWITGELVCTGEEDLAATEAFVMNLLKYDEENAFLLYVLGQARWKRGHADEAFQAFERSRAIDPEEKRVYLKEAECLMELSRTEEALRIMKRAGWVFTDDPKVMVKLSECYARLGDYGKALTLMENYIRRYRDLPDIEAYTHMGMLWIKARSDGSKALEYLTIALYLAQDPAQEEMALFNLASAYRFLGDFNDEKSIYVRILQHRPYNPEAWYRLGELLEAGGMQKEAAEAYRRVPPCNDTRWTGKAEEKLKILGVPLKR